MGLEGDGGDAAVVAEGAGEGRGGAVEEHADEGGVGVLKGDSLEVRVVGAGGDDAGAGAHEFTVVADVVVGEAVEQLAGLADEVDRGFSAAGTAVAVVLGAVVLVEQQVPVAVAVEAVLEAAA